MSDQLNSESEEKDSKKKGPLGKIKDAILPDQEEQAAIISTLVRIGVLIWSGGILTLNYVSIPGLSQQKIDPTFIASVFTGVLSSLGIQTASKKGDGTMKMQEDQKDKVTKQDMEELIAKATTTGPAQVIRVEQGPIRIIGATDEDSPPTDKV